MAETMETPSAEKASGRGPATPPLSIPGGALLESLRAAILIVDTGGIIQAANAAAFALLFGQGGAIDTGHGALIGRCIDSLLRLRGDWVDRRTAEDKGRDGEREAEREREREREGEREGEEEREGGSPVSALVLALNNGTEGRDACIGGAGDRFVLPVLPILPVGSPEPRGRGIPAGRQPGHPATRNLTLAVTRLPAEGRSLFLVEIEEDPADWLPEFLSTVGHSSGEAMVVTDWTLRIVLFNESAERLFGCSAADVLGQAFDSLVPRRLHREICPEVMNLLDDGESGPLHACHRAILCRHSGSEFLSEMVFDRFVVGGGVWLRATIRDITQPHRQFTALQEADDRFGLVLQALGGTVWDWNVETGAIHHSGALARRLGFEDEALIIESPKDWHRFIHPLDLDRYRRTTNEYLMGRLPSFRCEYRVFTRRGTAIWLLDRGVAVYGPDRKVRRMVGILTEVTEARQRQQQVSADKNRAEEENRAKNVLLLHLTRELQISLNGLLSKAEGLDPASVPSREFHSAVQPLVRLVEDLDQWNRIETDSLELEETNLDLTGLLEDCQSALADRAKQQDVLLAVHSTREMPRLRADGKLLRKAILALLNHALACSEFHGQVTLEAGPTSAGGVKVHITDTGVGFSAEDMAKLFEPFARVDVEGPDVPRPGRLCGGTGLDLPLSKAIVECHGGALEMVSRPGDGSIVTLFMPPERAIWDRAALASSSPFGGGGGEWLGDDNSLTRAAG